jgi:uncharacterized protein YdeI (YjbR/CyaY-like superfamily)
MITAPDDYFLSGCGRCPRFATPDCSTRRWTAGLAHLRRICLDLGLAETAKYGHPCYMHANRNVAIFGALRDTFRLGFFHAALLKDPEGVLEKNGPNTQHADTLRFRSTEEVAAREPTLRAYLREAMAYAEQGLLPLREPARFDLPDELIEALDADPELAEAFHALTPGRQRSYVIALSNAKKPETRHARISGFRSKILAGKGALDR